ncbi:MAG: Glu/Leu/Phe/Val dehydrogenase dimerization domain-containing protein, partial [Stackebrandtia sp.]
VMHYVDPVEGFSGWLVYDDTLSRLAAGGCRVRPGLTQDKLAALAARMTLKQRVLGIGVDGAKCGIDYDPRLPGKAAALQRFLAFLKDQLMSRFSMGCDMGTQFSELDRLARTQGIPSIKYAIKLAQGFTDAEFFARARLLDIPVGMLTFGQRRAGHALAHIALAAARAAGITKSVTCGLQGFGTLGRAGANSLAEERVRVTAVADEHGCVTDLAGLDIPGMLAAPNGTAVPETIRQAVPLPPAAVFEAPCEVMILAASEDAMSEEQAATVPARVVVVGANCGLRPAVADVLHRRGILVIPDFIGGIGGSASMEAVFGPETRPTARGALDMLARMMWSMVEHLVEEAKTAGVAVEQAACALACAPSVRKERPYGCSPYLHAGASV